MHLHKGSLFILLLVQRESGREALLFAMVSALSSTTLMFMLFDIYICSCIIPLAFVNVTSSAKTA